MNEWSAVVKVSFLMQIRVVTSSLRLKFFSSPCSIPALNPLPSKLPLLHIVKSKQQQLCSVSSPAPLGHVSRVKISLMDKNR